MENSRLRKSKLIIVTLLILVEMATIFLMYKSFSNKEINSYKKHDNANNMFAILYEQNDGTYQEYTGTSFQIDKYTYNEKLSGCVDLNGKTLNGVLTYKNGMASVTVESSVNCYLYFDKYIEAYAIYSDTDQSLTILRSKKPINKGDTYNGKVVTEVYSDIESSTKNNAPWSAYKSQILKIEVLEKIAPSRIVGWFSGLTSVKSMDLQKLDISKITSLSQLFMDSGDATEGTEILISDWDTSNVTTMSWMFSGTNFKNSIDISKWDVSKVTNMKMMFDSNCVGECELNLSNWNVSNVTNMELMFYSFCANATSCVVKATNWNAENVTNVASMFKWVGHDASKVQLDLSGWNVPNVTDMSYMFNGAGENSTEFKLDFSDCNASNATNIFNMFDDTGYNADVFLMDLSGFNVSNVTSMASMFFLLSTSASHFSLDVSNWDTSNVTSMASMFYDAGKSADSWSLIGLDTWDTSSVTSMRGMFDFAGANSNKFELDLSSWDTSNVIDMSSMFYEAGKNASEFKLDLSGWDTSNVTNMESMFYNAGNSATSWSVGDISKWNTGNVTDMSSMFQGAGEKSSSKAVDLSGWDVMNVEDYIYFSSKVVIPPKFGAAN